MGKKQKLASAYYGEWADSKRRPKGFTADARKKIRAYRNDKEPTFWTYDVSFYPERLPGLPPFFHMLVGRWRD